MRVWLATVATLLSCSCSQEPAEKVSQRDRTPEEAFYAKYPFHEAKGLTARVGPAPYGDPKEVAKAAIRYSEHPCPRVTAAVRNENDGSVTAKCSNRERYNVFRVEGVKEPVVFRCSALRRLLKIRLETCEAV
jgi:hypothetical protein